MKNKMTFKLLVILITALSVLIIISIKKGRSEEVHFSWTANTDSLTEGYRIYENGDTSNKLVVDIADKTAHTATTTINSTDCKAYYIVAYNQQRESDISVIRIACPQRAIIPIIQKAETQ